MILESLIVPLTMDGANFFKTAGEAESKTSSLVSRLARLGGSIVTGGLAVAGAGLAGLTAYLVGATKGAAEAEKIQAQLNSVLLSTKGAAGMTANSVNDLATSLSRVTPYEDDVIVQGENMLLTFTNIGKKTFPLATAAMLDLSTAMGQDLKSSAIQLGKALNDPTQGVTALTKVGVTFTAGQKDLIKSLQASGKMEEAQAVILKELNNEFGGSAKAAGQTFAGQLEIVKNALGNVGDTIGGSLLPTLGNMVTGFSTWFSSTEVQTWITNATIALGSFVANVIAFIPQIVGWFQTLIAWFQANPGVIVAALGTIGIAVLAFGIQSLIAMLPIILVFGAIAVAIYLLYQAWTTNLGGIQGITAYVFSIIQTIFSAFQSVFSGDWTAFGEQLKVAWTLIWDGIKGIVSTIWPVIKGIISTAVQGIINFITTTNWASVGKAILDGIGNGLKSGWEWLKGVVSGLASSLFSAAKRALGISSPSKAFMSIGKNMMLGMGIGIDDFASVPQNAIQNLTSSFGVDALGITTTANVNGNGNSEVIELLRTISNKREMSPQDFALAVRDELVKVM